MQLVVLNTKYACVRLTFQGLAIIFLRLCPLLRLAIDCKHYILEVQEIGVHTSNCARYNFGIQI
jgi:hypothetical protein